MGHTHLNYPNYVAPIWYYYVDVHRETMTLILHCLAEVSWDRSRASGKKWKIKRPIRLTPQNSLTWCTNRWNAGLCWVMTSFSKFAWRANSDKAFHGGWYGMTSCGCIFNGDPWRTGELAIIGTPCIWSYPNFSLFCYKSFLVFVFFTNLNQEKKGTRSFKIYLLLLQLLLDLILLVLTSFVLKPHSNHSRRQSRHFHNLFFHKCIRPRICIVEISVIENGFD